VKPAIPIRRTEEKILILLIILSTILLSLPSPVKFEFANRFSGIVLYPALWVTGRLIELRLLNRDLAELDRKLNQVLIQFGSERLKASERTDEKPDLLLAYIVMRDPKSRVRFFTINRGDKEGVRVGAPAVYQGNLIGRVITVSSNQAVVATILNPNFRVSIQHLKSGTNGILETTPQSIRIKYFLRDVPIQPGDTIVTSGFGSFAPPGLLVGRIDRVEEGKDLFFQELTLLPFINLGSINHLYILR